MSGERALVHVSMPESLGGYCLTAVERVAYLPAIFNPDEGNGAVGRFLTELKATHDVIVVATVLSSRLGGMLERRGFFPEMHWVHEWDTQADCMVWRRPTSEAPA